MSAGELKQEAKQILSQKWIPGIEQNHIREGVTRLEEIIHELQTRSPAAAQTILLETATTYEHAQRVLYSDVREENKPGIEDLLWRLEDILNTHEQPVTNHPTRYLLNNSSLQVQNSLSALNTGVQNFKHIPFSYVETDTNSVHELQAALHAHNLPLIPEKHYHATPLRAASHQENLELIHAPTAWQQANGEGIRIAVLDTGCDYTHPEINERFRSNRGYNFVKNNALPLDDNGHGTHVAGIIAGNNVGVAPQATLYALKILQKTGQGSQTDFMRAADWCIDEQVDLINASFGSTGTNEAEQAMCNALQQNNILLVAAAGNRGTNEYSYPASHEGVVSVAAITHNKTRAPFSQHNDQVRISAPGINIRSCVPGGYDTHSGTSMAAPHVTGVAALLKQNNSQSNLYESLLEATEELGSRDEYGRGLVRADKAVNKPFLAGEYQ